MTGRLFFWPLLVILVLLGTFPFWMRQPSGVPSSYGQTDALGRTPDYVLENFSAIRTDDDGVARHTLLGKRMVHYPDDDSTDLIHPRLIKTEPGKPAMQVTADQAQMSGNGEDIYLSGNVTVVRNAGKGRAETTMTTSLLHVIPDDDIARTDKPVVITEMDSVINAVGMEICDRTGVTRLLSRVKVLHHNAR